MSAAGYPAAANGVLTPEGLRRACGHVWRDSNSTIMLGADILNSEPVSYDDKQALMALKRHIAAAGPRAFVEDVLPNLGFGPLAIEAPSAAVRRSKGMTPQESALDAEETVTCVRCGREATPLHPGCKLCEDCCDCRPADEA